MKYDVYLTYEAEDDIFEIYKYVAVNDSQINADKLFKNIKETIAKLENLPKRGHHPPELKRINILEYLEVHFKPYRIIYQILDKRVFIHCVLDGRRNLQDILQDRFIR